MTALVATLVAGYLLGRWQPIRRARRWADTVLAFRNPETTGRLTRAVVLALVPELVARLLWHRLRHGEYPQPPVRRPSPAPALVQRHHADQPAEESR